MSWGKSTAFIGLICLTIALLGVFFVAPRCKYSACDLRFRHNEICCSHTGVNPFRVWNQEVESEVYEPLAWNINTTPGVQVGQTPPSPSGKLRVHAYPAWHTTFFWFYGWLSQAHCIALMYAFYAAVALGFLVYVRRWQPAGKEERLLFWGFLLMMLRDAFLDCFDYGNYGFVLLFFSVVLYEALKRKQAVWGGVAWSVMMIKPNVSLLLFWPLLFQKRYLTIAIAIAICVLGLLWPAWLYDTSPIELLLQIPVQGSAFIKPNSPVGIMQRLMGPAGVQLWMGGWFVVCGALSYAPRKVPSWGVRLLPALLLASLWTYSREYDRTVFWFLYVVVLEQLLGQGPLAMSERAKHLLWGYVILSAGAVAFTTVWLMLTQWNLLDLSRFDVFRRMVSYIHLLLASCVLLLFVKLALRPDGVEPQPRPTAL